MSVAGVKSDYFTLTCLLYSIGVFLVGLRHFGKLQGQVSSQWSDGRWIPVALLGGEAPGTKLGPHQGALLLQSPCENPGQLVKVFPHESLQVEAVATQVVHHVPEEFI